MYFHTENLAVGYRRKALIRDINIGVEKGQILSLIGPNGAGKSTILKTIIRQIPPISGKLFLEGEDMSRIPNRQMAQKVAVVLTDRVQTELTTCGEIVAAGRYPYTNRLGKMTQHDRDIVRQALARVHGEELEDQDFSTLSDGQRQRIMLARAICQEPEMIVLDEPTAFLDIRYKIELLDILRQMAREKQTTVILSLHEIDLAAKISDLVCCVKGDRLYAFGKPEEVLQDGTVQSLYDIQKGSFNLLFGSVELGRPEGKPRMFVLGGGGKGIPCYRALQRQGLPFATGILSRNDVDYQVARELAVQVFSKDASQPVTEELYRQAEEQLLRTGFVIDTRDQDTPCPEWSRRLLQAAERAQIPVIRDYRCWLDNDDAAALSGVSKRI